MQPRISMITLGVADVERSVRFYRDGLGFPKFEFDSPSVAFFRLNGTWLGLYGSDPLARDAGVPPGGSGFRQVTLAHNVREEAQVREILELAERAGATITQPARKTEWGGYAGYFADPDGHLWEVAHNPFFWIGPEEGES